MILSRGRPISSASSAESSADCTIASRVTSWAVSGEPLAWFSSISRVSSSWSSEPQLTPMRTGLSWRIAISTISANCRSFFSLEADIAGIDAVFGQRLGAGRMIGQQLVADIVEVADERHVDGRAAPAARGCAARRPRLVAVDRDAHDLGARAMERGDLGDGRVDIGRVGVGHRLDDDRRRRRRPSRRRHRRRGAPVKAPRRRAGLVS
jgi:hypothetical protein